MSTNVAVAEDSKHPTKFRNKNPHGLSDNPAAKTDSTAEEHSPVLPTVGEFPEPKS